MMVKDIKDIEFPEEGALEASVRSLKSATDIFISIPIFGPMISTALSNVLSDMYQRRIDDFAREINDILHTLPEQIYQSEEFAEGIKRGFFRYINEGQTEKRKAVLNLTKSFLKLLDDEKEKIFSLYALFDDLLVKLSLPALDCLLNFEDKFKIQSNKELIVNYFLEKHPLHGRRCFMELTGDTLLEEVEPYRPALSFTTPEQPPKVIADSEKIFKLSPLAAVFLCWLRNEVTKTTPD
jgi:hypothetical protein